MAASFANCSKKQHKKTQQTSTSEERLIFLEFHLELSHSWGSAVEFVSCFFLYGLLLWASGKCGIRGSVRLCSWASLTPERSTGTWALCACNQTSLGKTSAICSCALKHCSGKLTGDRTGGTWATSTALLVDDLPLDSVLIHKSAFWNETGVLLKTRFVLVTAC